MPSVSVSRCWFESNWCETTSDGGAGAIAISGYAALGGSRNTFIGNHGPTGAFAGPMYGISETSFFANVGLLGGAISVRGNQFIPPYVFTSVFEGNAASSAGGAIWTADFVRIENCALVGNRAGSVGGAIAANNTSIRFCTIAGNSAPFGGGVHITGLGVSPRLDYSLLWGNSVSPGGGQWSQGVSQLTIVKSVIQGGLAGVYNAFGGSASGSVYNFDPMFRNLAGPDGDPARYEDNDFRLSQGSPAIDLSGLASPGYDYDVLGKYRVLGPFSDLGAAETPVCQTDLNDDGVADQADLRYLITVISGGFNPYHIDPDINQDGAADQADVDTLINIIAGGNCPL